MNQRFRFGMGAIYRYSYTLIITNVIDSDGLLGLPAPLEVFGQSINQSAPPSASQPRPLI